MRRLWVIALLLVAASLGGAAYSDYTSVKQKFDAIESGRLKPGARVILTYPELNAWAAKEAPAGVRNVKVRSIAPNISTGDALIDFGKLQRAAGHQPGWLMSKLLDGERPVSVTARIRSSRGSAIVDIQSVEISGISIDGRTLDFLVETFVVPAVPAAVIGKSFEIGHGIDRFDVTPAAVAVLMR